MKLMHIAIDRLTVSPANMRGRDKAPDLANILPSVRARGVLVPLIVRPNCEPDSYEIVAGRRRYHAALALAAETGEAEPLPCAVMAAGDDAAALEASLIENVARLDADEVTRWESFVRLVREGRSPEDIAMTFGLTDVQVRRTLALGNLLPRIFDEIAPSARCELQDYRHKIGCGNMDQWGNIQDVRFARAGLTEERVRHEAQVLALKLRTGGSTAGG